MRKFLKFAVVTAAAFAIISCEKTPNGDKGSQDKPKLEITEDIEFTLEVKSVDHNEASIRVTHNGTTNDTWYGFATTETNINKAVQEKVAEITEGGKITGLKKATATTVTARKLDPETAYTFIVFAITPDGDIYGVPNSVKFTTKREGFQVNPAWTVTYIGDYEYEGEILEHVVAVESTDQNTYFTAAWPKAYFEQFGIEKIAQEEIASWLEYLSQYGYGLDYILTSGNSVSQVNIETEFGNEWYILAIGADANGNATGYYAISELVTIVEEEPTEGYAAWLGGWTITGTNGCTQNVTFAKGVSNRTFKMRGYEGSDAEGFDVIVEWSEEDGVWVIYNQMFGTFDFGTYGPGDVWFLGEDVTGSVFLSEVPICIGGAAEDGSFVSYGYEEEWTEEDGTPASYKVVKMEFLVNLTQYGELSYITGTYETGYPTFPLTFTPAANASSVKEFKTSRKNLNSPLGPKMPFKAYDFNKSARIR